MGASDHVGSLMTARIFSALVPFLCGVLGVVLTNMPLPLSLGGGLVPAPLLGLIPIYFWCLMRPDLMTPAVTFAIGILQDILGGGPPGIWTLGFVLAYAAVSRQRDVFAGLSGPGAVLGFATAALITCAAAFIVMTLLYHMPPLGPLVGELAMTALFYIPGAYVLGAIHRHLVGPLRSDV